MEAILADVAAKLPKVPSGQLSPADFGALSSELQAIQKGAANLAPPNASASDLTKFNAILSSVISGQTAAAGGVVTPVQDLAIGDLQTIANGLLYGVQFYHGTQQPLPAVAK